MSEDEKIKIITSAIENRNEIETWSESQEISFHPYLLYQDISTKRYYCYGYYADTDISIEPKSFDLFLIDEVVDTEEEFIVKPFWRTHNVYKKLATLQLKSIAEVPFDIS
jgi:hypothetical protein